VFQGGGPKGIAFVGALNQLQQVFAAQKYAFTEIRRVAGTSAGAITAMMLAVGYTPEEIRQELDQMDLNLFVENVDVDIFKKTMQSSNIINILKSFFEWRRVVNLNTQASFRKRLNPFPLTRMFNTPYLCSGDKFLEWAEDVIVRKTGMRNLTFGELHRLAERDERYKELFVVATQLSDEPNLVVFNSEDETMKDILVADIIRASMSIPFVFKPFQIRIKNREGQLVPESNHQYVDGGLIKNFPLDLFDKRGYQRTYYQDERQNFPVFNEETLGFSLVAPSQERVEQELATIGDLSVALGKVFYDAESLLAKLRGNDQYRTIYIDSADVSTLDFNLTLVQKQTLIANGERAVQTSSLFSEINQQAARAAASSTEAVLATLGGGAPSQAQAATAAAAASAAEATQDRKSDKQPPGSRDPRFLSGGKSEQRVVADPQKNTEANKANKERKCALM
jgi:NTE family protein